MTSEQRLAADHAMAERLARDEAAIAACDARAGMVQAMHPDRSLLGLHGQAAAGQVRRACLDYYARTGIVPGF